MSTPSQPHPLIDAMIWTVEADYKGVVKGQILPARRLRGGLYLVRYSRNGELNVRHQSALCKTREEAVQLMIKEIREDLADLEAAKEENKDRILALKAKLKEYGGES